MGRICSMLILAMTVAPVGMWPGESIAEERPIPFPEALDDAAIDVDRLADRLDDSLLFGNGDLTAVLWEEEGALAITLTKNDVWDARLDTSNDPPLPTLDRIKELGRSGKPIEPPILPEGVTWSGKDSYYAHSYPCPRMCARIRLSNSPDQPFWRPVRLDGELIEWVFQEDARRMRVAAAIQMAAGASAAYAYGPIDLTTGAYVSLRVRVSGTPNADFAVEVIGPDNRKVFESGWIQSPPDPEEHAFVLPADRRVTRLILSTRTKDGKRAENRFGAVAFEGSGGRYAIDLGGKARPEGSARLDLRRAVAKIAGASTGPPSATVRLLAQRNVLLIESSHKAQLLPIESADLPPVERGRRDGTDWLLQRIPGDRDWPGMRFAVASASHGSYQAFAVVTSFEADDVVAEAVSRARATVQIDPREVLRDHEAIWSRFWSRSGLTIDDELLQRMWYQSLYFLRCASKPGAVCPGLFFGLVGNAPPWHSDFHPNLNLQKTFYGAYASNHPELAEPYDRLIRTYLPRARWLAKKIFGIEGAYYPHVLFAYEPPDPEACKSPGGRQYLHHLWAMTLGVSGFAVQPLWLRNAYAPDREDLEKVVYPPLREVAKFYAEFIERCGRRGERVVLAPSISPEHRGWTPGLELNRNCTFDIAMVRYTLEAAIKAARTLQRDEELVGRLRRALGRLPDYPLYGEEKPVVVDVEGAEPIAYNIIVPITPVFPGDAVTWQSPESERELFARTVDSIRHNGNCIVVWGGVARARLSMPETQNWIDLAIERRVRPNGTLSVNRLHDHWFDNVGFWTEQFGAGILVTELLVQSVGDVIRVFPALRKGCDAQFRHLRTEGGFLVSAVSRDDSIEKLSVESTVGGTVRLKSPWRVLEVQRNGNGTYDRVPIDENGIALLPTKAGDVLGFRSGERAAGGGP